MARFHDPRPKVSVVSMSGLTEVHGATSRGAFAAPVGPELKYLDVADLRSVRSSGGIEKARNHTGLYYWPSTKSHVWTESQAERHALMLVDFEGKAKAVIAQPFCIVFGREISLRCHFPDFALIHRDGSVTVVDVRPEPLRDERATLQFDLTRQVCTDIGWGYQVIGSLPRILADNLSFLSCRRLARFEPTGEMRSRILAAATDGATRDHLLRAGDWRYPGRAAPWVDFLTWHRDLDFEIWTEPLRAETVLVRRAEEGR